MIDTPTIARHLADGIAGWRDETDPDTAETYADAAAYLESTLREVMDADPASDRFALASGLYTFAARFHGGQRCPLYRILGVLSDAPIHFRPGLGSMEDGDRAVFDLLRGIRKGDGHGAACDMAERAAVILAMLCSEPDDDADDDDADDADDDGPRPAPPPPPEGQGIRVELADGFHTIGVAFRLVSDSGADLLIQTEADRVGVAVAFGFRVAGRNGCPCPGTDGTVRCPYCGKEAATYAAEAAAYLETVCGSGIRVADPGYFE